MPLSEVEALDDETWARRLAEANWIEEQRVERVRNGLLAAVRVLLGK